ncbi:MAG: hypothetical protein NTV61_05970 [Candidatus Bathyarchaeota archaeon]|nr:hypothetical protein [Candidatus Bathyarchaeota archaeon]
MPMRIGKVTLILALALTAITVFTLVYAPSLGTGTVEGRVSIKPWTPVEPVGGSHPPPEVYTSRRIILEGTLLPRVEMPMNGTGYFTTEVRAGTYSLTMSNCTFLGCSRVLPMTVTVKPGQTTTLQIDIDTGIR